MFRKHVAFEITIDYKKRTVEGTLVGVYKDLEAYYLAGGDVYCYHVSGNRFTYSAPYGQWCMLPHIQKVNEL